MVPAQGAKPLNTQRFVTLTGLTIEFCEYLKNPALHGQFGDGV
jgi:hypothetical protein